MWQVLFLALLELAGAGLAVASGARPALACALGVPIGLALWLAAVALASSAGVPWSAALTLVPAGGGAAAGLALALRRSGGRAAAAVLVSALAIAGLAALAVAAGILAIPAVGHDALLAARLAPSAAVGPELAPGGRFLVFLQEAAVSLAAPLASAPGAVAGLVIAALVAVSAGRMVVGLLGAASLLTLHAFAAQATTFDVPVFAAMFLVAFAGLHREAADDARLLPLEAALLFGLAATSPAGTWIAVLLVPLAYRGDRRPAERVAGWLGALAAAIAWWYLLALELAPPARSEARLVELLWLALAPLAALAAWLAIRGASIRRALIAVGLLAASIAVIEGPSPRAALGAFVSAIAASPSLLVLLLLAAGRLVLARRWIGAEIAALAMACGLAVHLLAGAAPAPLFACVPLLVFWLVSDDPAPAAPTAGAGWLSPVGGFRRAAAWLLAGALAVTTLANLAEQVRQHNRLEEGKRLVDPGPTRRVTTRLDLHDWLGRRVAGSSAVMPARLSEQAVLFRHLAGVDVRLVDPPPEIPAGAALDLLVRADAYRSLHFKRDERRAWVAVFVPPGASRFVLAESPLWILYWLPEDLYLEVGGRPVQ
jgi:hypothetical protein